jgi:hypothetical protein
MNKKLVLKVKNFIFINRSKNINNTFNGEIQ